MEASECPFYSNPNGQKRYFSPLYLRSHFAESQYLPMQRVNKTQSALKQDPSLQQLANEHYCAVENSLAQRNKSCARQNVLSCWQNPQRRHIAGLKTWPNICARRAREEQKLALTIGKLLVDGVVELLLGVGIDSGRRTDEDGRVVEQVRREAGSVVLQDGQWYRRALLHVYHLQSRASGPGRGLIKTVHFSIQIHSIHAHTINHAADGSR